MAAAAVLVLNTCPWCEFFFFVSPLGAVSESDRCSDQASSIPQNVYEPLRHYIEARDPTSASLITKALEGDDEEYRDLISGDTVRKQLVLLAALKEQASRRVAEREDEEMRIANREADLRTNNMMKEREFMEEAESEFREKMTRYEQLSMVGPLRRTRAPHVCYRAVVTLRHRCGGAIRTTHRPHVLPSDQDCSCRQRTAAG